MCGEVLPSLPPTVLARTTMSAFGNIDNEASTHTNFTEQVEYESMFFSPHDIDTKYFIRPLHILEVLSFFFVSPQM